ncbi:SAICAR synthetase family protein [Orientia tsutsugamushi str. TA716]|uniref:SAICAR synthetase family protein n=1 Tax=Orientia tsutsugamushi str. TA716 TaxID=1359175 RepID=A0A0F3NS65_ORITS|nr:SAICAR synthetase family protein [Orientia tsutsugamushi str. TA716]
MRINAEKVIQVSDKGVLNNVISNYIFKRVSMVGINHHLIQKINMREQLIYALNIIPVKVCITIVIYNEVCV